MNSKLILSAAVAALLFSSCRKTDNATPDTRAIVGYRLTAFDESAGTQEKATGEGVIHWTAGFAHPREMRFGVKQDGSNYSEDHVTDYRTLDTARIDLFDPASKAFGHIALAQGIYKEVELRMKFNAKRGAPALQLKGIYTSSTITTPLPVVFQVVDVCDIKTEVKDIALDHKANFNAVTFLDLSRLSDGITESMISNAQITDGTLLISSNSNKQLYKLLVDNLTNNRHTVDVSQR